MRQIAIYTGRLHVIIINREWSSLQKVLVLIWWNVLGKLLPSKWSNHFPYKFLEIFRFFFRDISPVSNIMSWKFALLLISSCSFNLMSGVHFDTAVWFMGGEVTWNFSATPLLDCVEECRNSLFLFQIVIKHELSQSRMIQCYLWIFSTFQTNFLFHWRF